MTTTAFLDSITLDDLERDPYPIYERLRREAPVAWVPAAGVWFITRFDDCAALGSGEHGTTGAKDHPTLQRVFGEGNVLTSSGEEHDDLREGIDPKLQPKSVLSMTDDLIRPIARKYADNLRNASGGELMGEFFEPVSVDALRHVMGLQDAVDTATLRRWFTELNGGIANFGLEADAFAVADRASAEIESVLRPMYDRLVGESDDSMLSHMMWAGCEGGEPRSLEHLLPSLKVILLGGMQEPGHAAGSTMLGLFEHPEELAKLREDPEAYIPQAVHEGLRWIAPIGAVERQTTHEITIHGQTIPENSIIQLVLGSANRDAEHFAEPDRFIMERGERSHQAFGNGEHFCAGHFFGRQTEHIMFEELFRAIPDLELDRSKELEVNGWVFRAPKIMHATWTPNPLEAEEAATESATPFATPEGPGLFAATVSGMRLEAADVISLELREPSGTELPQWSPGDHIELHASDGEFRQYSLCGDPADRTVYRLAILREEAGRGVSRWAHDTLRVGDRVTVSEPLSNFALSLERPVLLVGGGIGITPLLPMARAARAAGRLAGFVYCGRERGRMAFREDAEAFGAQVRVSDEGTRADLAQIVSGAKTAGQDVYACGPERMLDALAAEGERQGVTVVMEHFTGVEALREGDREFTLVLGRSGQRVLVPEDRTALDIVEKIVPGMRSSCREGNCGSCEVGVTSGTIDHRDLLLTKRQREANDRMMLCVSRSADDGEIVIDL